MTGYTLALIVANWWADMFYGAGGEPTHCHCCGSPFLHEQPLSEHEIRTVCSDCTHGVAYWAYGAYDPFYRGYVVDGVMCWAKYAGPLAAIGGAIWLVC
jgi:hypothetical protein